MHNKYRTGLCKVSPGLLQEKLLSGMQQREISLKNNSEEDGNKSESSADYIGRCTAIKNRNNKSCNTVSYSTHLCITISRKMNKYFGALSWCACKCSLFSVKMIQKFDPLKCSFQCASI